MRTTPLNVVYAFSLLFILILAVACKKDSDPNDGSNEQLYTLTFDFQDFDASTKPLNHRSSASASTRNTLRAGGVTPQAQVGYLYFWSFNGQSLIPDIASHSGASITYDSPAQPTYPNGWAFEEYDAGSSFSIRALSEILIAMPVERVTALEEFGFDITSTNAGPKSFSLEYSFDQSNWMAKSEDNQFMDNEANAKNSFVFDFSDLFIGNESFFYIRIIPLEGNRDNAGNYTTQGVTRLDNIRLTGLATPPLSSSVDKLHYYVFDAISAELVDSDILAFDPASPSFNLSLPYGQYQVAMIRNHSAAPLLLPAIVPDRDHFYYANPFSNHLANVFASEMAITLDTDKQESITLERYYSQIKFELTDTRDLSHISRIVVSQEHPPFFYAPYRTDMPNPILDQSDIILHPDLGQSKEILFNQFMGKVSTPQVISYRLDVYDTGEELLRTFSVSAPIRHNVQLVFRGELLFGVNQQANFQIYFNEDWDDEVVVGF